MKIHELKELLNQYPDDWNVLVDGHKGKFSDFVPKVKDAVRDLENDEWQGKYSSCHGAGCWRALVLSRTTR